MLHHSSVPTRNVTINREVPGGDRPGGLMVNPIGLTPRGVAQEVPGGPIYIYLSIASLEGHL